MPYAMVEMAMADFFHCENIPDAVVESPRFKRLISVCRLLGDKFVPPNSHKIGGPLLDLNFKMTYERNKEELPKEAGECSCHVWYKSSRDCRYY
jgi:hypothetical protein